MQVKVFESDEIVMVRSAIPGSVAIAICSPLKMMYSYGSSVITLMSCAIHSAAIAVSSSREKTWPVGLCGELSTSARVFGVIARRSASMSKSQFGGVRETKTG